jgi:hypothetical protein
LDYFTDREGAAKRDREYRAYLQDKLQRAELEDIQTQTGFFDRLGDLFSRGLLSARSGIKDVEAAIETDPVLKKQFTQEARRFAADSRMEISGATTEQDVKDNFLRNAIPYIIEKGAESLPEMIAMAANPLGVLGVGLPANLGRQGRDAAELQGRQDVSGTDVAKVAPGAIAVTALDTLGLGGILAAPAKTALGRIGKAALLEGTTEAIQSAIEYANPRVVTGSDIDAGEMFEQAAFGALAGGGIGGGIRGAGELATAPFRRGEEAPSPAADFADSPEVEQEYLRLVAAEVQAVRDQNSGMTQRQAYDQVIKNAGKIYDTAIANTLLGTEGEADAATDIDTGMDVGAGGGAGAASDLGTTSTVPSAPDVGETVGGGLGGDISGVSVPDVGEGAGVAPLAPATQFDPITLPIYEAPKMADRKAAAKPIIASIIDANLGDVAVPAKVTNQIATQMAQRAARKEVFDPTELTMSVLAERGIAAAPVVTAPEVAAPVPTAPAAPSVDQVAVAPVKAAIESVVAPTPPAPGVVPSLAQAAAREVGITPTPPVTPAVAAVDKVAGLPKIAQSLQPGDVVTTDIGDTFTVTKNIPLGESGDSTLVGTWDNGNEAVVRASEFDTGFTPQPYIDTATGERKMGKPWTVQRAAPSATITPAPIPTPQQIAENLQGFAAQEAQDRGLDVPMFREGARDVQRGLEPIPDQQILDEQGPEFLDAYKAGQQWAQERVAEAQAAPVDTAPVDTAPVDTALVEAAPVEAAPVEAAPAPEETPKQRFNRIKTELAARVQESGALTGSTWVNNTARSLTSQEGPVTTADYDTAINDYVASNRWSRSGPDTRTAPDQTFEDIPENTANLTEEPRTTDIYGLAEELPEAERVNVRARLDRIMANYAKDGDVQRLLGSLEALREDVERRIDRDRAKRGRDRVRGFERAMEVIYRAERTGQLTPEAANLVRWLLEQNPAIADELALSLRLGGTDSPAGQYVPASRIATIFTSRANDGTAAHEVLHHAERLMPDNVRGGIRAAWMKRIQDLIALADRTGNTDMREVLGAIVSAYYGDAQAQKVLRESFESGSIPYSVYHLSNPSEFWAVNATDLVGKRANRTGWIGAARNWVRGLVERAKDFFGLPNDAAVIAGLNAVLEAESGTIRGQMLSAATTQFMDQTKPEGGAQPQVISNGKPVVLTEAQTRTAYVPAPLYRWPLGVALLALLGLGLFPEGRKRFMGRVASD